jgi:hypothetical protein
VTLVDEGDPLEAHGQGLGTDDVLIGRNLDRPIGDVLHRIEIVVEEQGPGRLDEPKPRMSRTFGLAIEQFLDT